MKVLQDGGEEAVLMKKIIVFKLVRSGKIISGKASQNGLKTGLKDKHGKYKERSVGNSRS